MVFVGVGVAHTDRETEDEEGGGSAGSGTGFIFAIYLAGQNEFGNFSVDSLSFPFVCVFFVLHLYPTKVGWSHYSPFFTGLFYPSLKDTPAI